MGLLRIFKPALRLSCCCLSLGLLTLTAGCGRNPRSVEHADVSGKVSFQGKPLPGGRIAFVTVKGGFPSSATINEDGTYKISAPIGDVQIGVDNGMLRPMGGGKGPGKGGGPPKGMSHPKPPGANEAKEEPVKGRFVNIPSEYADPGRSGLTFTVKPGSQTHDIELSASPPSGAPGQ